MGVLLSNTHSLMSHDIYGYRLTWSNRTNHVPKLKRESVVWLRVGNPMLNQSKIQNSLLTI